LLLLEWCCC